MLSLQEVTLAQQVVFDDLLFGVAGIPQNEIDRLAFLLS
jgi:hypothetical protein